MQAYPGVNGASPVFGRVGSLCYHGDVEELMGWNFSQGWLWDRTVALRHWKQKGTPRPLRVTTKASLWALELKNLLLGLFSGHWVVPSATTSSVSPSSSEKSPQEEQRQDKGLSGRWQVEKKGVGHGDRKRVWRTNATLRDTQSPSGPTMLQWKSTDSWASRVTKCLYVLHCFCFSKDLGSKQGSTSGSVLLQAAAPR